MINTTMSSSSETNNDRDEMPVESQLLLSMILDRIGFDDRILEQIYERPGRLAKEKKSKSNINKSKSKRKSKRSSEEKEIIQSSHSDQVYKKNTGPASMHIRDELPLRYFFDIYDWQSYASTGGIDTSESGRDIKVPYNSFSEYFGIQYHIATAKFADGHQWLSDEDRRLLNAKTDHSAAFGIFQSLSKKSFSALMERLWYGPCRDLEYAGYFLEQLVLSLVEDIETMLANILSLRQIASVMSDITYNFQNYSNRLVVPELHIDRSKKTSHGWLLWVSYAAMDYRCGEYMPVKTMFDWPAFKVYFEFAKKFDAAALDIIREQNKLDFETNATVEQQQRFKDKFPDSWLDVFVHKCRVGGDEKIGRIKTVSYVASSCGYMAASNCLGVFSPSYCYHIMFQTYQYNQILRGYDGEQFYRSLCNTASPDPEQRCNCWHYTDYFYRRDYYDCSECLELINNFVPDFSELMHYLIDERLELADSGHLPLWLGSGFENGLFQLVDSPYIDFSEASLEQIDQIVSDNYDKLFESAMGMQKLWPKQAKFNVERARGQGLVKLAADILAATEAMDS